MSGIDDFFAKKDKKKKGTKGKFSQANTDVLAKNLEEKDQKRAEDSTKNYSMPTNEEENIKKDKEATPECSKEAAETSEASKESNEAPSGPRNDDEWLSYDDDNKDYSGLKIGSLKIGEPEAAIQEEEEEHEINEEGEKVRVKRGEGGPWNKSSGSNNKHADSPASASARRETAKTASSEPAKPAKPAAPSSENASSADKGSGYVPPHLRGGAGGSSSPASGYVPPHMRNGPPASSGPSGTSGGMSVNSRMAARRGTRAAPNISSEVSFPSLGGAEEPKNRGRMDDFEEVRSGGQTTHGGKTSAPRLALGNKFDALRD